MLAIKVLVLQNAGDFLRFRVRGHRVKRERGDLFQNYGVTYGFSDGFAPRERRIRSDQHAWRMLRISALETANDRMPSIDLVVLLDFRRRQKFRKSARVLENNRGEWVPTHGIRYRS